MYTKEKASKDKKRFEEMSIEADQGGDHVKAGICRVEAFNSDKRVGMKKAHKPNLGPYSADNLCHCVDCGKTKDQWLENEECLPQ